LTTGLAFNIEDLIVPANNGLPYVELCMSSIHNQNFSIYFTLPALKKRVLIISFRVAQKKGAAFKENSETDQIKKAGQNETNS
jgi:hypothetical protein